MSWGRYLKLAVIICVGSSLTLVHALAQKRQGVARATSGNENHWPEAAEQPKDLADPASDNAAPVKGATLITGEPASRTTQPRAEADAALAGPAPMPEPLFLPSADHLTLLDRAYLDAYSILSRDNNCTRFYGGSHVIEVLNELKKQLTTTNIDASVAVIMRGTTTSVTSLKYGFSYRLFDKAELNLRGAFFHGNSFRRDQTVPSVGIFMPNTREARVTILLHELAHLVQKSRSVWLLPNDGNNGFLSQQNTMKIIATCGEQIKELRGTSYETELQAARRPPESALQANLQQ